MIDMQQFHKETLEDLILNGVYKITAKHNNLVYIGSTGKVNKYKKWTGFKLRWLDHLSRLLLNKHHNKRLQNIVNKYGVEDLQFSIIEITKPKNAIIREQYWIDYYDSFNNGLNLRPVAESNLGRKTSTETKLKQSKSISKALKEKWSKEEHHMKGYIMSDEHKQSLSISKRKFSEDEILKIYSDLKSSYSYKKIREKYKMSQDTLRRIINGKFNNLDWSFLIKRTQKINKKQIEKIVELKNKGTSHKKIGEVLNVSQQCVSYWLKKINNE
jgi:group I intron endonuclease